MVRAHRVPRPVSALPLRRVWIRSKQSRTAIAVPGTRSTVGNLTGVGRVYQQTFVDTCANVAAAALQAAIHRGLHDLRYCLKQSLEAPPKANVPRADRMENVPRAGWMEKRSACAHHLHLSGNGAAPRPWRRVQSDAWIVHA